MKLGRTVIVTTIVLLAAGVTSCGDTHRREIILEPDTAQIEGWLDARGELSVFPDRLSRDYDPYNPSENYRCVTVVAETAEERETAVLFSGKRIRVWGRAVAYDELDYGSSFGDQLLSKRYYKNTMVENACLRLYIFIGHRFESA